MGYIILANDGISHPGKTRLEEDGHEFLDVKVAQNQLIDFINEKKVDVILVRSATTVRQDVIDACPTLKIIGRGGVGMDNIDVEYAKSKGLHVINTPNSSSRSVAELVFAHFFTLARNLQEANRHMPLEGESKFSELKKLYSNAVEIRGKTLGVIGFGGIGKEVIRMGIALGMKPMVLSTAQSNELITIEFFDGQSVDFAISTYDSLKEFLPEVDFLSINVPKTKSYLIDEKELGLLKKTAIVVNTARGGVLNEEALLDALDNEKLAGAALDVFEEEPKPGMRVLMNSKISLSPHIGGSTEDAQEQIGIDLAIQISDIYNNRI